MDGRVVVIAIDESLEAIAIRVDFRRINLHFVRNARHLVDQPATVVVDEVTAHFVRTGVDLRPLVVAVLTVEYHARRLFALFRDFGEGISVPITIIVKMPQRLDVEVRVAVAVLVDVVADFFRAGMNRRVRVVAVALFASGAVDDKQKFRTAVAVTILVTIAVDLPVAFVVDQIAAHFHHVGIHCPIEIVAVAAQLVRRNQARAVTIDVPVVVVIHAERNFGNFRRRRLRRNFRRAFDARVLPRVAGRIDADLLRAAPRAIAFARVALLVSAERRAIERVGVGRVCIEAFRRRRQLDHLRRIVVGDFARAETNQEHQNRNRRLHVMNSSIGYADHVC